MSDRPSQIRCVLLAHFEQLLLLPNAVLAEVIGYREPEAPGTDAPVWYRGDIEWRQFRTPIVRLDLRGLDASEETISVRARIAVCYALGKDALHPYIGFVTNSVPRLAPVRDDNLQVVDDRSVPEAVDSLIHCPVQVRDESALIPDLEAIEARLRALRS